MKPTGKKKIIIHNIGLCEHKTFFGMTAGHCHKCGKAFKNCDICYPNALPNQKTPIEWSGELLHIWSENCVSSDGYGEVKAFISSLLQKQIEDLRERIKGLEKIEENK